MAIWVVFLVSDLGRATRVTQLVRGARLDENGLLYVPDRPTRRRPPVSSRQDAAVTLNEHWLDYALAEYGAGEELRQALLARRLASSNSASEDNDVADVTPVEIHEEEGYEFPGYNEDDQADQGPRADSTECAICLQEYEAGDNLTMVLCPGTHTFHRACLGAWLERNLSCPLCRYDLSD